MTPYHTTTTEHNGKTITISWHYDHDCREPWQAADGHGVVSDWVRRDAKPGERELSCDHGSRRFYDYNATLAIAERDGWGVSDGDRAFLELAFGRKLTAKELTMAAVEADFEHLYGWCNDHWHWCGYICDIDGHEFDSCWGHESKRVKELEAEILASARAFIDKEADEAFRAACGDIATISA